jgi:hypothetical protein
VICQVYQHINVYRFNLEKTQMSVPFILWMLDSFLGPSTPAESRTHNYNILLTSGYLRQMQNLIDLFLRSETMQEANYTKELRDCRIFHEAFHLLLHPKTIERLRLMQLFMTREDIVNYPSTWRRLWVGSGDDLEKHGSPALSVILSKREDYLPSDEQNNDSGSGHSHDVHAQFVREPDVCLPHKI